MTNPQTMHEYMQAKRAARGRPALPKEQKCGTTTGYAQGCRCERCRAAVAAYQREYSARPDMLQAKALRDLQHSPAGRQAIAEAEARADREARDAFIRDTLL